MEFFLIYLLTVGWTVKALAAVVVIACLIAGGITGIVYITFCSEGSVSKKEKEAVEGFFSRFGGKIGWVFAVCFLISVFVPSKDDIYLIAGGGLSLMAAQNEEVQQIPENAAKAVNDFLERIQEQESE